MKTASLIINPGKIVRMFLVFIAIIIFPSLYAQIINPSTVGGAAVLIGGLLKHKKNQPANQTATNQTNKAQGRDTAAVIDFNNKPAGQFTVSAIKDLSGIWEGEQSNGDLIMYYKLCLTKLNETTYSGYDYCEWAKNLNRTPVNANNGVRPHGEKSLVGSFDNGELQFSEIQKLDNTSWGLTSEKFKVVDDNGQPAIINDNNQPQRKFYLKQTSQTFPQEYLKYVLNANTLQIINPSFKNSEKESVLKFNDHGQLTFSLKNTSDFDLDIKGQITTTENNNGIIDYDKLFSVFTLPKNTNDALPATININTNYAVPAGSVHFNIAFTYNNMVIAQNTIEVPSTSFYKTSTITSPDYSSSRMKAVAGYYGFSNAVYTDVSKSLEPLVTSGDKMAAMWKVAFLSTGRGEYKLDENSAYTIGKTSLNAVEEKARNGDAEALYLLFYACQVGVEGETAQTLSYDFLKKSADAGFMPAMYDAALNAEKQKDYATALQLFQKLYDMGFKKAANMIGTMYQQGFGVNKDENAAIGWYRKGIEFGDAEAMLSLANVYATGTEDAQPDVNKAMSLATSAAAKNYADAMLFLGVIYIDGNQGIAKNTSVGLKWLKQAAEFGNRKAMLALGKTYFAGENGIVKDQHTGLFWITKAAELGSPNAMLILSGLYKEGTDVGKNQIIARYWYNQAAIGGYATQDATGMNAQAETFLDFMDNADFSPSYRIVDEYGDEVGDSGDGLFNGLFTGMFGAMSNYYGNQQQLIDGLEYICKKDGCKIYGGTVSSNFVSNLYLKQGQTVYVKCYGTVSTGMFSGVATADGLDGWQEYAYIKGIRCSAVMAEVKDGTWQFIGQKNSFTATKDGPFVVALNGIDYRNYKGYFDIVVQVPDN